MVESVLAYGRGVWGAYLDNQAVERLELIQYEMGKIILGLIGNFNR